MVTFQKIPVYCTKCGRKVGNYDGITTTNLIIKCKDCHKKIVYHPDTKETEIKRLDERGSSSGTTW